MKSRTLADQPESTTAQVAQALGRLSDLDLLRLKAMARLRARGLPGDVGWTDLLNEAVARALEGSRPWPAGVPIVAFLAGVMRSIASEHWRRFRHEASFFSLSQPTARDEPIASQGDPERNLAAIEALAALDKAFAGDRAAAEILAGVAAGLSAGEIRERYGMSMTDYDSARKRIRRTLLRQGIVWRRP